ncbi:UPF0016-domain-containing protein [Xylona heveae TC161]|uniref:UPF0016-domain-containing protein n=1 Tax=Xylona heveae (strain CBS 132557 / TC161) TaxID=1328760 RepID=A0A165AH76_XYLHT|nr:UPF0016-domain-containing protein [Xylona heveae TC161]KZF20467.1 UPF0016-domain-containing protein [Xylona heveae TC161]
MKMRVNQRASSLLFLLLVPALSSVATGAATEEKDASLAARDAPKAIPVADDLTPASIPTLKPEVGTKDAPVDGKDGKPHAGPWVDLSTDKKPKVETEEEVTAPGKKPPPKPLKDTSEETTLINGKPVPDSKDGVMDDPNRSSPKKGTTGTEGGVSEKERDRKAQEGQTGAKVEKTPDSPKEAPPLPHSEQEKIKQDATSPNKKTTEKTTGDSEKPKGAGGLQVPTDLPDKPHDIPRPVPATSKDDPLALGKTTVKSDAEPAPASPKPEEETDRTLINPLHSYVLSLSMIIFSEIGDKTFLVAALMAMKYPRLIVFSAAVAALFTMTILSAVLGHAVPTLIPKRFTNFLAAILFLVFGAKMLREGYGMSPDEGVSEEMKEVEMELEEKEHIAQKHRRRSSITPYVLEAGRGTRKTRSNSRLPSPPRSPSTSPSRSPSPSRSSSLSSALIGFGNLCSLLLTPAWVQTFAMTFLGEWGDRSQIATIAMAAGSDYWWVTAGAITGHAICTAAAVIGGRAIAGKVSLRVVTLGGAGAFLIFGVLYLAEAIYYG